MEQMRHLPARELAPNYAESSGHTAISSFARVATRRASRLSLRQHRPILSSLHRASRSCCNSMAVTRRELMNFLAIRRS